MTISDKQQFLKSDDYIRNFCNGIPAEVTYRNAINTRHRFGISYTKKVANTVVSLNPDYFKFGKIRSDIRRCIM